MDTHLETVFFPYRVEAVKHIIYLVDEPCPDTSLIALLLARAPVKIKREITFSYITPLNLKVKDPKVAKEIIGFNSEKVFTISNPQGVTDLTSELQYENLCVDSVLAVSISFAKFKLSMNQKNQIVSNYKVIFELLASSKFIQSKKATNFNLHFCLQESGHSYVVENLLANKNNKQKVLDIITKNIVAQTLEKEVHLECTCGYSYMNPFKSYNRCKHMHIVEK